MATVIKPNSFTRRQFLSRTALAAGVGALVEKPLHVPKMLCTISRLMRESVETRLARVAGKVAEFDYLPAWPEAQADGIRATG